MLVVALVLAVVGLAALVTAVVTSNEIIAWVCIAASVIGVLLLIIDAIRERGARDRSAEAEGTAVSAVPAAQTVDETYETFDAEYPDTEGVTAESVAEESVAQEPADDLVEESVDESEADEAEAEDGEPEDAAVEQVEETAGEETEETDDEAEPGDAR